MKKCPWIEEDFDLPLDVPCPVCGAKGNDPDEVEAKCVDRDLTKFP